MERESEHGSTDEIEVTAEMVEAGIAYLERTGIVTLTTSVAHPDFVAEFFREMYLAASKPSMAGGGQSDLLNLQHRR